MSRPRLRSAFFLLSAAALASALLGVLDLAREPSEAEHEPTPAATRASTIGAPIGVIILTRPPNPTAGASPNLDFPTPALEPIRPSLTPSTDRFVLWYTYYPTRGQTYGLAAVTLDKDGHRNAELFRDAPLNLGFPPPIRIPGGAGELLDGRPPPDGRYAVITGAKWSSFLIDLVEKHWVRWLKEAPSGAIVWQADSATFMTNVPGANLMLSNITEGFTQSLPYPSGVQTATSSFISGLTRAPDKPAYLYVNSMEWRGDSAYHQATELDWVNIATGEQRALFRVDGGRINSPAYVSVNEIAFLIESDLPRSLDRDGLSSLKTELWLFDHRTNSARILTTLHPGLLRTQQLQVLASGEIVFIDSPVTGAREPIHPGGLYAISPATSKVRELAYFEDKRLFNARVSPDGQWVAVIVASELFGDIRIVSADGLVSRVVAGPTPPESPLFWTLPR